jgi:hypothetical protein
VLELALRIRGPGAAILNARQDRAVARYHFNIRNGHGFTADDEGTDLPSDDSAREQAVKGARSLLSAELLEGTLDLNGQIEVTAEERGAVMTVRFAEAVEVKAADGAALANQ